MNPEQIPEYVEIALQIVGVASLIAAVTPTKKDNVVLGGIKTVLNVLGGNWYQAKNKDD